MATEYAIYELEKVKGKKEYITTRVVSVEKSLTAAYRELERYKDDCLDYPAWFNKKTREHVYYELDDRMLYVPNMRDVEDEDAAMIGIYGRKPIYYIDEYPNPYAYYKLHKKRNAIFMGQQFFLEGVR